MSFNKKSSSNSNENANTSTARSSSSSSNKKKVGLISSLYNNVLGNSSKDTNSDKSMSEKDLLELYRKGTAITSANVLKLNSPTESKIEFLNFLKYKNKISKKKRLSVQIV